MRFFLPYSLKGCLKVDILICGECFVVYGGKAPGWPPFGVPSVLRNTLVPGIWPNFRWSPADQVSVLRAIAMHKQRCDIPGSNNWSGFRTRCLRVAGAGGGACAWLRRAFAFIKSPGWRVQTIVNVSQDRAFCPMGFFLTCSFISSPRFFSRRLKTVSGDDLGSQSYSPSTPRFPESHETTIRSPLFCLSL